MKKMLTIALVALSVLGLTACNKTSAEKGGIIGIAITKSPEKTIYYRGEALIKSGLEVSAIYENQTIAVLNEGEEGYQVGEYNPQLLGVQSIKVTYANQFETNFTVVNQETLAPTVATVVFKEDEKVLDTKTVSKGNLLDIPEKLRKEGYYFAGWFVAEDNYMWDFKHDVVEIDTVLTAKYIKIDETNLILDAYAQTDSQAFVFKTLQELKDANIKNGTTVHFMPGVYWTDDYKDPADANTEEHPGLVGISFEQTGLTFRGVTDYPSDVRIAGNRGQTVGSKGNWNVIAVGSEFSAFDITIANYCSLDLVYPRDPAQNVARRTDARVQAQTLATNGVTDRMYFENVHFVSFLNMMAGSNMKRAYFKDCYFQLTDDALTAGETIVYDNCTFDLYGAHPTWGGTAVITVFFNSTFNVKFTSGNLYFAKSGGNFAIIDSYFKENKATIYWEDFQNMDAKHYVYNNQYEDGSKAVFTPEFSEVTQELNDKSLSIFKSAESYNISNLLKGSDNWNPAQQNIQTPYKLVLSSNIVSVESSDVDNEIVFTPTFLPQDLMELDNLTYEYDQNLFEQVSLENGILKLKAKLNSTGRIIESVITVAANNGLVAQKTIAIRPEIVNAPVVTEGSSITIKDNQAILEYVYDQPEYVDHSNVLWYMGENSGDKRVLVGVTTLNNPYLTYELSRSEVNYYLTAVVTPKYEFSLASTESFEVSTTRKIMQSDIEDMKRVQTDFAHIAWTDHQISDKDVWYADTIKPVGVEQPWEPNVVNDPWRYTYGTGGSSGQAGALDKYGLITGTQGARLLYTPEGTYADMSMSVSLSPEKTAGQGFGSANQHYLEIYLKYDYQTHSGYALRIERVAKDRNGDAINSSGNAVRFTLLEYVNGIATILDFDGNDIMSSAYLPNAVIDFKVMGNQISVDVITESEQSDAQAKFGLIHEIHFTHTLTNVNSFGGFGFQFTGTVSNGNRTMIHSLDVHLD